MCDDVLAEVLSSGNRKQLVILTKKGKRFSRLVDRFFVRAPLLDIDIILWEDVRFNLHIYCHIIIVTIGKSNNFGSKKNQGITATKLIKTN